MSLSLRIDTERWQRHLAAVAAATPGLVAVTKGNGYGFGLARTAAAAAALGLDTIAVGLPEELTEVGDSFGGDLLVLQPWQGALDPVPTADPRVIRTAATAADAAALAAAGVRHVVEALSSMRRFGIPLDQLAGLDTAGSDGVALHLPLDATAARREGETAALIDRLTAAGRAPATVWVSHLATESAHRLRTAYPDVTLRERIGTRLWLGDRGAAAVESQVLAVHRLVRGDRFGYRQRRVARAASLLIVSGGTAHGIGMAAPVGVAGLSPRGKAAARGVLEAGGRALSPFRLDGRRLWFAEPPHMQVSMLLADADLAVAIGQPLAVDVRMTTVSVDEVVES